MLVYGGVKIKPTMKPPITEHIIAANSRYALYFHANTPAMTITIAMRIIGFVEYLAGLLAL